MDNQERNREALIEHIAEQDRIIRRRNKQISELQASNGALQRALQERPEVQENPRPLTADDITDEMVERAVDTYLSGYGSAKQAIRAILRAALTGPTRPEEKVERVLHRYWSGDINGDDLADRIVEEMNR